LCETAIADARAASAPAILDGADMISIVIPAYNEARALPRTLENIQRQRGAYEIIVVDGGSSDATRDIARAHSGARVIAAPKGRASQMNAGAREARGGWLLFLHADTLLPEGALAAITTLDGAREAGCFRQRFSGDDWRLDCISWLHNRRCQWTRIIYGDQAMFVRRDLFRQLGGFPCVDILEDVLFSEKLVVATRPCLLDAHVVTDARKFVQMGIVRSFLRVAVILTCHRLRLPIPARIFFSDVR
jgi:rSAM/selenodomain-associated transferase 2